MEKYIAQALKYRGGDVSDGSGTVHKVSMPETGQLRKLYSFRRKVCPFESQQAYENGLDGAMTVEKREVLLRRL